MRKIKLKIGDLVWILHGQAHCRGLNPEGKIRVRVISILEDNFWAVTVGVGNLQYLTEESCLTYNYAIKEALFDNPSHRFSVKEDIK